MSLSPITFPAREESRVVKLWNALCWFHTHHHMLAWFCWLGVATVAMIVGAIVSPA